MKTDARQRILDAFREVLLEGSYDALSVSALLRRAHVGRTSFYAHFKGKEDLLGHSVGQLTEGLRRASATRRQRWAFLEPLLLHVQGHRAIYQAFAGRESEQALERQMRKMLRLLLADELARQRRGADELQMQWMLGGLWTALVAWIERRLDHAPAVLASQLATQLDQALAVS